jgi:hypothetical protein
MKDTPPFGGAFGDGMVVYGKPCQDLVDKEKSYLLRESVCNRAESHIEGCMARDDEKGTSNRALRPSSAFVTHLSHALWLKSCSCAKNMASLCPQDRISVR